MKKAGFTLIEILVVVLIIGILGAIALPQYQRAVLKSRYSGMMPIAKALAEGNEVFFLEHGHYSENPADLMIAGRDKNADAYPDGTRVLMYDDDGLSYVRVMNDNVPNARYIVYQKHSENFADTTQCEAADDRANELCQALGGQLIEEGNSSGEAGWTAYLLSGRYGSTDSFAEVGTGGDEPGTNTEPQTPSVPTCGGVEQPDDIQVDGNPATGTATCVNGQWKYQWSGGTVYDTNYDGPTTVCTGDSSYGCAGSKFNGKYNVCDATEENGCAGSAFTGYTARCYGDAANGCAGSTFSGEDSRCYGDAANGCANSTFSGEYAYCEGYAANACVGSTFSGKRSLCLGEVANGCAGAIIQAGAFCHPYKSGGCDGAKYGTNPDYAGARIGGCWNSSGGYCPNGAPTISTSAIDWDDTTHSFRLTGWQGGYCDPNAMVTGVCPNGSPTGGNRTTSAGWNGGYCTKAMYGSNCPNNSPTETAGQCWNGSGGTKAC